VLAAAHDLVTDVGVDGLTMRALARRLGVAPNALYTHVTGKTELVDALLDDLLAGVQVPAPDTDPVLGLTALMSSTYDVLTAHPDLVALYLARQGARGPNAVRLGEVMDVLLRRAGVATDDVPAARRVLIVHTIGFAAFAAAPPLAPDAERPIAGDDARRSHTVSLGWLLAGITTT
jgi:AcrR family transcriptional regulator